MKSSAFNINITWKDEIPDNHKVSALDIKRNYTAILLKGGFFLLEVGATIKQYKGEEIKHGFYYVQTKNYFPLKGNRFYDYQVVIECLKRNIISKDDIKFFIEGIPCDDIDKCLKTFVDYVYMISTEDKVKKIL